MDPRDDEGAVVSRAASIACLLLAGCATPAPRVDYARLTDRGAGTGTGIPYRLTATRILLAPAPADANAPPSLAPVTLWCEAEGCFDAEAGGHRTALSATAVPIESRKAPVLTLRPHDRRFITTALAPTYFENSLRLRVLTVEARDRRVEAIETVGAVIGGIRTLLSAGNSAEPDAPTGRIPIALPQAFDLEDVTPGSDTSLAGGWTVIERAGPEDRTPGRQGFLVFDGGAAPAVRDAMLSSVCREAEIVVRPPSAGFEIPFRLTVADPAWLMAMPFPPKGAMIFHRLCGVDIRSEPVTEVPVSRIAESFFDQARRITGK